MVWGDPCTEGSQTAKLASLIFDSVLTMLLAWQILQKQEKRLLNEDKQAQLVPQGGIIVTSNEHQNRFIVDPAVIG